MPSVALPPSVPSNHDLTTRSRAAAADPARPSSPFAALLDDGGDSTPAAPTQERRQPGAIARSAPRSGETTDAAEPAETAPPPQAPAPDAVSATIATIVPAGKAAEAGADTEAEVIPADDVGGDEAATIEATEAVLLAAATVDTTAPDPAAPPVPVGGQPAAPVDQPPAPVAGLAIAAADPLPPDAVAPATDPAASPRAGSAAAVAGHADTSDAPNAPGDGRRGSYQDQQQTDQRVIHRSARACSAMR